MSHQLLLINDFNPGNMIVFWVISEQATFRHPLRYRASLKGVSVWTILLSLLLIRYRLLHSPSFQVANPTPIPPYCFLLPSYFVVTIADCFDDCNVLCSYSSPALLDLRQFQSQPLALMITWRRPIANLLPLPTASHPNLARALFPSAGIFTQSSICGWDRRRRNQRKLCYWMFTYAVLPNLPCLLWCAPSAYAHQLGVIWCASSALSRIPRVCWCASPAFPYTCWALMYPITNTAIVRTLNSLELTCSGSSSACVQPYTWCALMSHMPVSIYLCSFDTPHLPVSIYLVRFDVPDLPEPIYLLSWAYLPVVLWGTLSDLGECSAPQRLEKYVL